MSTEPSPFFWAFTVYSLETSSFIQSVRCQVFPTTARRVLRETLYGAAAIAMPNSMMVWTISNW